MNSNTELIIYTTDDGVTKVEATFDGDTVWLSQEQMGELFQRDKSTISRHIRNIFAEGELDEKVVVAEIATTTLRGAMKGKTQNNITGVYNLEKEAKKTNQKEKIVCIKAQPMKFYSKAVL